jgi:hypothetical protein
MKITEAKAIGAYRLQVGFDNVVCGIVDLPDCAGVGVFESCLKPGLFAQVAVTNNGALAWPGDLDLCPDAIYLRLTGKSVDEDPALRHRPAYA